MEESIVGGIESSEDVNNVVHMLEYKVTTATWMYCFVMDVSANEGPSFR